MWSFDAFNLINSDTLSNGSKSNHRSQIDFFANQNSRLVRQSSYKNLQFGLRQQYSSTPVIQKLCKCIEEELIRILGDIELSTTGSLLSNTEANISILNDDFKYFNEYLQDNLQLFSENLCNSLTQLIDSLNTEEPIKPIVDNSGFDLDIKIKKILLICRLAHALPYNCPHLKICFNNLNQQFIQQRQQLLANSKDSANTNLLLSLLNKKKQLTTETKVNIIQQIKFLLALSDTWLKAKMLKNPMLLFWLYFG